MPELPEVETIKRDLEKSIYNQILKDIIIQNFSYLDKQKISYKKLLLLKNHKLLNLTRKGKYLLFHFDNHCLIFHLGLTGSLILRSKEDLLEINSKHNLLILVFENYNLIFRDIRKFGKIFLIFEEEVDKFLSKIGVDALEVSLGDFINLLLFAKCDLKSFFLNQRFISGLGNIYIDELLFRVRLSPFRKTNSLTHKEMENLYYKMRELLYEAIALRGSTVKNYVDALGSPGRFQEKHLVYGKKGKPCPLCNHPFQFVKHHQRGTTFCPQCQK